MLSLLQGVDLKALGHNTPAYVHLVAEAMKLCFADRERYYGDPRFVDVPDGRAAGAGVRGRSGGDSSASAHVPRCRRPAQSRIRQRAVTRAAEPAAARGR